MAVNQDSSGVMTHRTISLPDGAQMAAHIRPGNGPRLILMPGTFSDAHTYDDVLPLLDPSFHVVVVELRGQGGSWPPPSRSSIESLAADLLYVLDALGIARFCVGGHSLGGMIAIEMLRHATGRLDGVVSIEGWTSHQVAEDAFRGEIETTLSEPLKMRRAEMRARVLKGWSEEQRNAFARIWRQWDGSDLLAETDVPVLELWGDRGRETPSRQAMRIPDRPNIELVWFRGASHALTVERPRELAAAVSAFVTKNARVPG